MIAQVDALDRDQRDRPGDRQSTSWAGEWGAFLYGPDLRGTFNCEDWPPNGWRPFVVANSGAWSKLTNSDEVMSRIGLYERRLIDLRRWWIDMGGQPSPDNREPVQGYRPPPGEGIEDKLGGALGKLTTIALLFAGGYFLSQLGGFRRGGK
jgi:hypothetical protein